MFIFLNFLVLSFVKTGIFKYVKGVGANILNQNFESFPMSERDAARPV